MSRIEDVIGKSLTEIQLSDIRNFFLNDPRESEHLEFKSGEVDMAKLRKEVCALLNYE